MPTYPTTLFTESSSHLLLIGKETLFLDVYFEISTPRMLQHPGSARSLQTCKPILEVDYEQVLGKQCTYTCHLLNSHFGHFHCNNATPNIDQCHPVKSRMHKCYRDTALCARTDIVTDHGNNYIKSLESVFYLNLAGIL